MLCAYSPSFIIYLLSQPLCFQWISDNRKAGKYPASLCNGVDESDCAYPDIIVRMRTYTLPQALRAQGLLKEAEHVESQSAETVLTPDECQLLGYLDKGKRKRKEKAGSLQWAYMAIARLGGFMDSKRTGIASWGALW